MFLLLRMDSVHLFILLLFVSLWCSFSVWMEFWKASILWRSIWICISLHVLVVFQIRPEAIQKLFSMGSLQRLWNLHKQIEKNKVLNLSNICTSLRTLHVVPNFLRLPRRYRRCRWHLETRKKFISRLHPCFSWSSARRWGWHWHCDLFWRGDHGCNVCESNHDTQ